MTRIKGSSRKLKGLLAWDKKYQQAADPANEDSPHAASSINQESTSSKQPGDLKRSTCYKTVQNPILYPSQVPCHCCARPKSPKLRLLVLDLRQGVHQFILLPSVALRYAALDVAGLRQFCQGHAVHTVLIRKFDTRTKHAKWKAFCS